MSTRALDLGLRRSQVEMKNLWRNRQAFAWTILIPVMMLLLFASIFTGTVDGTSVKMSQVYVAGIMGSALMSTGFVSLAIGMATERESGMIKRLAGTPMPKSSYFIGKVGMVLFTVAVQTVVLIALGLAFFHLSLPSAVSSWLTFVWVFVLGVTASTLLGIAVGGRISDAKAAPAVVPPTEVAADARAGGPAALDLPRHARRVPARLVQVGRDRPRLEPGHRRAGARGVVHRRLRHLHQSVPLDPPIVECGSSGSVVDHPAAFDDEGARAGHVAEQ